MADYLYYKRGDEWVRVNADRYTTQAIPDRPGQCTNVFYHIYYEHIYFFTEGRYNSPPGRLYLVKYLNTKAKGPIGTPFIQDYRDRGITRAISHISYGGKTDSSGTSSGNAYNSVSHSIRNFSVRRASGQENIQCDVDENSGCKTTFTLNGSTVLVLDSCPEISTGRGCSDCCKELIPIARNITI